MAAKKATPKAKTTKKASTKQITEDDVRQKAQAIYDARMENGTPGSAHTDWVQAEKELGVK